MNEAKNKESIDQPSLDSALDAEQTDEESQDQPTEEAEDDTDDEANADDGTDDEDLVDIDGEKLSKEQLKEYVSKGKDYTFKTQQLAEERRAIENARNELAHTQQPKTPEDDEIRQAKDTLRKYNVAFAEDVDLKIRQSQIQAKLDMEFETFQRQHNLGHELAALVRVAGNAYRLPYDEAYKKFWGGGTKTVQRKIVGVKKSASTPVSGKSGGVLTRADIASMPQEQYDKLVNSGKLDEMIRKGEL